MSRTATSLLIFVLASFAVPGTRAQDRQAANREIYLYHGADRAQRLLSEARKEGGLTLYTRLAAARLEGVGPAAATDAGDDALAFGAGALRLRRARSHDLACRHSPHARCA